VEGNVSRRKEVEELVERAIRQGWRAEYRKSGRILLYNAKR
jgi:hypothetical protein